LSDSEQAHTRSMHVIRPWDWAPFRRWAEKIPCSAFVVQQMVWRRTQLGWCGLSCGVGLCTNNMGVLAMLISDRLRGDVCGSRSHSSWMITALGDLCQRQKMQCWQQVGPASFPIGAAVVGFRCCRRVLQFPQCHIGSAVKIVGACVQACPWSIVCGQR
jgi:hypothetical protein